MAGKSVTLAKSAKSERRAAVRQADLMEWMLAAVDVEGATEANLRMGVSVPRASELGHAEETRAWEDAMALPAEAPVRTAWGQNCQALFGAVLPAAGRSTAGGRAETSP